MNLGGAELLIVVGIAVLIFGAGWLPKAARNLGKAKVEFDEVQRQLNEAKDSVVEASGVKQLESGVRKANRVMNSSPRKLMKDVATSAAAGTGAVDRPDTSATDPDPTDADSTNPDPSNDADQIQDAEIVPSEAPPEGPAQPGTDDSAERDTNITLDFG